MGDKSSIMMKKGLEESPAKPIGRPPGAKDKKPRKKAVVKKVKKA